MHMFCTTGQHYMIHDTVHKKVNHSTAESKERTSAKLPAVSGLPVGQTCWHTAMDITRVEDLSDRDHTVWEVKKPGTVKQPTWFLLL